jgi:hypothetical protein
VSLCACHSLHKHYMGMTFHTRDNITNRVIHRHQIGFGSDVSESTDPAFSKLAGAGKVNVFVGKPIYFIATG